MGFQLPFLIHQTSTTTGTGSFDLIGSDTDLFDIADLYADQDRVLYVARQRGVASEVGIGKLTVGTPTDSLSRDTVLKSTNAGSKVSWTEGTRDIIIAPAVILPRRAITDDTTLTVADIDNFVEFTAATAKTLTLPNFDNLPSGALLGVGHTGTAGKLTLTPTSNTIDGQSSSIVAPGESFLLRKGAAGKVHTIGRGDWVPLERQVLSGASQADFVSRLAEYEEYRFRLTNVVCNAGGGAQLLVRISQDAGSTWKSSSATYTWAAPYWVQNGTSGLNRSDSGPNTSFGLGGTNSSSGRGQSGFLYVAQLGASGVAKHWMGQTVVNGDSSNDYLFQFGGYFNADTNAISGVRFFPSSSTITGVIELEGRRRI